jgi:hypothetical protein
MKGIAMNKETFESLQSEGMGDYEWLGNECGVYYPTKKKDIEKFFREEIKTLEELRKYE